MSRFESWTGVRPRQAFERDRGKSFVCPFQICPCQPCRIQNCTYQPWHPRDCPVHSKLLNAGFPCPSFVPEEMDSECSRCGNFPPYSSSSTRIHWLRPPPGFENTLLPPKPQPIWIQKNCPSRSTPESSSNPSLSWISSWDSQTFEFNLDSIVEEVKQMSKAGKDVTEDMINDMIIRNALSRPNYFDVSPADRLKLEIALVKETYLPVLGPPIPMTPEESVGLMQSEYSDDLDGDHPEKEIKTRIMEFLAELMYLSSTESESGSISNSVNLAKTYRVQIHGNVIEKPYLRWIFLVEVGQNLDRDHGSWGQLQVIADWWTTHTFYEPSNPFYMAKIYGVLMFDPPPKSE